MSGPTLSAIVPTYNRAATVGQAIDSILSQRPGVDEVIVVDDGSTDETAHILAGYGDRIQVIAKKNGGVASARNAGIAAATGEWLAFLDSDDLWLEGRVATFLRDLPKMTEAMTAHIANLAFDPSGTDLFAANGVSFPQEEAAVIAEPFEAHIPGPYLQASILRKASVDALGGFDEALPIHEDILLLRRLALAGPWLVTGAVVGSYRRIEGDEIALMDWEARNPIPFYRSRVRSNAVLLADPHLKPAQKPKVARDLSGAQFQLAAAFSAQGEGRMARRHLWGSLKSHLSAKTLLRAALALVFGNKGYARILGRRSLSLRPDRAAADGAHQEGTS